MPRKIKKPAVSKDAYVVVERAFAYDDQYYHAEQGGNPEHIFLDEALATKVAYEKNIEQFMNLVKEDQLYAYLDGGVDDDAGKAFKSAGFTVTKRNWGYNVEGTPQITKLDAEEILEALGWDFFYVIKVPATVDYFYKSKLKQDV